jgi:hypothetical protein
MRLPGSKNFTSDKLLDGGPRHLFKTAYDRYPDLVLGSKGAGRLKRQLVLELNV